MEWKWKCNVCNEFLEDKDAVMRHILVVHNQAILYATPIAVDMWQIPKKKEKVKQKPQLPEKAYTEEESEDLSLE